eukprot:gene13431-14811_t
MFDQARALDSAMRSSESYSAPQPVTAAVPEASAHDESNQVDSTQSDPIIAATDLKCFFCGNPKHPRSKCPAREAICNKCHKRGHFAKVCRGKAYCKSNEVSAALWPPTLATVGTPLALTKSTATVLVNKDCSVQALFDSGSSESYIHPSLVEVAAISVTPLVSQVSMATSSLTSKTTGSCSVNIHYQGQTYKNVRLTVMPGLCSDLILGLEFQSQHDSATFKYGGMKPPLSVCSLTTLNIEPPTPFANLTSDCYAIATKSRRYSKEDLTFISDETINRFTRLDAFPLPRITDTVNEVAQYTVFSTVDLQSAYHQIPLKEEDKPYTAFEAKGGLYQFTRLPFGVTNGVACFQREMVKFVEDNHLKDVFPYLDNITVCGRNQEEHDANLELFQEAARKANLKFNDRKSVISTRRLPLLGYVIENGCISPDPERLRPLLELPLPHNSKSLNRCMGLFSYYSQWVPNFSDRIKPLTSCKSFPLSSEAQQAFEDLKNIIAKAAVSAIDEGIPFEVETDASDVAIAAALNQRGRPVALFSHTLQGSGLKHSAVEKDAEAIVESIRHWRHFLTGSHFKLTTDQKSVSYMFNQTHHGKFKNDKIMRWRIELSCYSFDIEYRPGKDNVAPDTLSRATCASSANDSTAQTLLISSRLHNRLKGSTSTSKARYPPTTRINTSYMLLTSFHSSHRGVSFMSQELRQFLTSKGVATSRTTSYNPMGNGQVEKYNDTVWKAVATPLKSRNLKPEQCQLVLTDVLHAIRSLLCTATNETPHERFMNFSCRSSTGSSIPSWLTEPGPVYVKQHVRPNKFVPLVEKADILQANAHYAHIRYPDGRETTVSTKDLAPYGQMGHPESPTSTQLSQEDHRETFSSAQPPGLERKVPCEHAASRRRSSG